MPKVSEILNPYFSHDMSARSDEKILKMFFDFRKYSITLSDNDLIGLAPYAAYGIFWCVVEYMHRNTLQVEDVEILADELRIDIDTLNKILNDYNLFNIENGYYISNRINKNLNKVEEKSSKSSEAASRRWTLSNLKKVYKEIFNEVPVLNNSEIEIFLNYSKKIESFKDKLPDILYTLSKLKFDDIPNFKPSINWLLENNNLPKLLNGQYGQLRSWTNHLDYINKKQGLIVDEPVEEFNLDSFDSKIKAIEYLARTNIKFLSPLDKQLMEKFEITKEDILNG